MRLQTMTTTRELTLCVHSDFSDAWFEHGASASERTALLQFACGLPRKLHSDTRPFEEAVERACASDAVVRLRAELESARLHHDALQREMYQLRLSSEVQAARADLERAAPVVDEASAAKELQLETLRLEVSQTLQAKAESERDLTTRIQAEVSQGAELSRECATLRMAVAELRQPAQRGRVGEFAVAEALHDAGFAVEDTSNGLAKDAGYLDLLVYPVAYPNLKIGVEVKSRDAIDPKKDILPFVQKVHDGISSGRFSSAIFISLRASHKRHAVLDMLPDPDGHATVPVSFLGPERGSLAVTLEALQGHACLHASFAVQCATMRQRLAQTSGDRAPLRDLIDSLALDLRSDLEDFNQLARHIASLKATLTSLRVRSVRATTRLCGIASEWAAAMPAWVADYSLVRQHALEKGASEAASWRVLDEGQRKRLVDHTGSREVVFKSLRT